MEINFIIIKEFQKQEKTNPKDKYYAIEDNNISVLDTLKLIFCNTS